MSRQPPPTPAIEYYYTLAEIKAQWVKATTEERELIRDYFSANLHARIRNASWMFLRYVPHGKNEPTLRAGYGLLKEPGITGKELAALIGHPFTGPTAEPVKTATPKRAAPKPLNSISEGCNSSLSETINPIRKRKPLRTL